MNRRQFLAGAAAAGGAALAQARRPNFVVIVTDDQGIGDVGCYDRPEARTPHLDRLAASGVRFTQWYANAPVCSASRAAILTGKYPDRTGVQGALPSQPSWDVAGLRAGETTLPAALRRLGYRTAALGKWHLGSIPHSRPLAQGFDEFFGWYSGWLDAYSHRYYQLGSPPGKIFHDLWRNETEVFEEPAYMTELLGREAQAFLSRVRQQPFLLYLAFGAPHYSMMAPKTYLDRFPASMETDRKTHLAMVAAVDDVVGALLGRLERLGLARNTVVFFQSDNGATREERASSHGRPNTGGSNGKYRGYKLGLFDGGMHVPAILRAPGLPAGHVENRPMMSMDLMPTFLAMADPKGEPPPGLDGHDILPVIRGEVQPHEYLFWSHGKSRAVRHGDWKLIVNPPQFPGEEVRERLWLSNLEADPSEKRNLAGEEGERVRRMLDRLGAWERSVNILSLANER